MASTVAHPVDDAVEELVGRVQALQEALEAKGSSSTRDLAEELVSTLVQLYGEGLERIIGGLLADGEAGSRMATALSEDPLICTLLLIHDLHPVPLADRVQAALDSVRPYMASHGGNVDLLSLEDGVATISLKGSCSDCSASAVTLELAIKQALEESAPDLAGLEVEGFDPQLITGVGLPMAEVSSPRVGEMNGTVLPMVMAGGAPPAPPAWFEITNLKEIGDGALVAVTVNRHALVIANVDGTLLAYEDRCAGCGGPLHAGSMAGGAVSCPQCENRFSLARAGRSVPDGTLQLAPVPLLRERGAVKVALAG
jgi:Fe-S cluster biogenesis protein NfuA/nitrite reductase/ring-hydroxylating ferredoxin subunit